MRVALTCALLLGCIGKLWGAAPSVEIVERWSTVFAGRTTMFEASLAHLETDCSRLQWRLTSGERTIQAGEHLISAEDERRHKITLRLPELKPTVRLEARLTVALISKQGDCIADAEKPVWIMSPDAFANLRQSIAELEPGLFDPTDRTASVLERQGLAFHKMESPGQLEHFSGRLLVIGEGVSLGSEPTLARAMLNALARGANVICLAPRAGDILVPGISDTSQMKVTELRCKGTTAIRDIDQQLDYVAWPGHAEIAASRVHISAVADRVICTVNAAPGGWAWIEAQLQEPDTKFTFCGFPLIEAWDTSPTPRYLLAAILQQHLSAAQSAR